MTDLALNFSYPWLLLLLIPALALSLWPHFRISKKYRRNRNRIISLVAHTTALVLAVLLLAGLTFSYNIPNTKNEIILLVDVSHSNRDAREDKDDFVSSVLSICDDEYNVGIVKFGYDQVYAAKISGDSDKVFEQYLESADPDTSASDLQSAIEYASTLLTNLETSKIVLISDGIQTDGEINNVIKSVAAQGIRVDTVYFPSKEESDALISSVIVPDESIKVDEVFNLVVTVQNNMVGVQRSVEATLTVYDNGTAQTPQNVVLTSAEQMFEVECSLSKRGTHEICVRVTADGDKVSENDYFYTFMEIDTFDNLLVIERNEGESAVLRTIFEENNYKVTDFSTENDSAEIPVTVKELCEYEQVVLVNIAYSDMPAGFESALNEYVYSYGGGLFTVGGENETVNGELVPHAYNRADMESSTYYKNMLPVLTVDYTPPIAVVIVVDTSGSMSKEKLAAAKQGAKACLDSLSDRDYCGVVSFAAMATEEAQILPVSKKEEIREIIDNINHGAEAGSDGTVFSSAILNAGRNLSVIDVQRKHVILVTDGDPGDGPTEYLPCIEQNLADEITLSIVGVNCEVSNVEKMETAAKTGNGKFYNVKNYDEIPTIMQKDLAIEAIAEIEYGEEFFPTIEKHTSVVAGIEQADIPSLTGYYGTVARDNAVVSLTGAYVPIFAQWRYGNGNVGSFMSDLNGTWSANFVNDPIGKTLINNMVQALFPVSDIEYNEIDYLLKRSNYESQLNVYGVKEGERVEVSVVSLNGSSDDVEVTVVEPNRRFIFDIITPGVYNVTIVKYDADGNEIAQAIVRDKLSYSKEYDLITVDQKNAQNLMTNLATLGKGKTVEDPVDVFDGFEKYLNLTFDPRFLFLILAIVAVLIDIAVRKFKFKWIHELIREKKNAKK
ncbi:MAG: VWA domain-containing protein [Clostridia bacterium]|nr:VWA domain-containing protein [Clostridia bacterium]